MDLVISDGDDSTADIVLKDVTVNADGSFEVPNVDVSSLKDGKLEVTATFTDSDGNVATATDGVAKDTTYGEETDEPADGITQPTVSITDNTGNNAELISGTEKATISGNIGETDAATVDLVISDGDDSTADIVLKDVTVNADGSFEVPNVDVSSLKDGKLEVTATFTDSDGNVATATDGVAKDTTYGEETDEPADGITQPTVSITDNTGNNAELISGTEKATISGNIGETDAATVDLVISDGDDSTADIVLKDVTVNADGSFEVPNVDVSSLKDGKLEVTATFTDSDGNVATATDGVAKDTTYGEETDEPADGITQPTVSITDNTGNNAELISGTEKATISGNSVNRRGDRGLGHQRWRRQHRGYRSERRNGECRRQLRSANVDVSSLKDGKLEVTATFTDSDGNVATATDGVAKDTTYGEETDEPADGITQPT
ncbi:hypothetical protein H6S61_00025 [Vibrio vulnificus]|uniref:hypothetical protein n=1 Tax=Vibrio vulnificus TaxID=672 RepID=UPI00163BFD7B|nr:hypothetical protein [Vibrio vulnificus]QNE00907.1 hypothetical protein H6S61_00025 [Vibrio vulnificus]